MEVKSKDHAELLVFGAGQMRTGTMSLQLALEHLYNGKCYHMKEVFKNPSHVDLWLKCTNKRVLTRDFANELFHGYVAAVDFPASAFYRDLMELYPNAKVILTVRDPDSWIKSVRQTTIQKQKSNVFKDLILYLTGTNKFIKMAHSLIQCAYQRTYEEIQDDDSLLKECYLQFNDDVKKVVPADKLLIFEAKEGWAPLCKFLGKDIPNIPYPSVNNTEEFRVRMRTLSIFVYMKILVPVSLAGLAVSYYFLRVR